MPPAGEPMRPPGVIATPDSSPIATLSSSHLFYQERGGGYVTTRWYYWQISCLLADPNPLLRVCRYDAVCVAHQYCSPFQQH
jgi:hypothetical protein